jgi:hypothetical protein
MSRSRTLTKTIALTPATHARVMEIRENNRLRTYDDAIRYLLGDFSPADEKAYKKL